jgi:hypothetical protein
MQVSLFGGTFLRLDKQGVPLAGEDDRHRSSSKSPWAAEVQGFNVHAGVVIHKGDREGLERLCRYGARPALSLQRLSILPDGRVAYALRKPRKNGATHLVLSPVQFLARIAALVPPPRFPLLRFAGVLAPKSPWRKDVVPHPQSATSAPASTPAKKDGKKKTAATASAAAAPLGDLPANGQRPPLADAPKGPRTSLGEGDPAARLRAHRLGVLAETNVPRGRLSLPLRRPKADSRRHYRPRGRRRHPGAPRACHPAAAPRPGQGPDPRSRLTHERTPSSTPTRADRAEVRPALGDPDPRRPSAPLAPSRRLPATPPSGPLPDGTCLARLSPR